MSNVSPNPLVVKLIADVTGAQISLSWGTWALAMLLPGLVALALLVAESRPEQKELMVKLVEHFVLLKEDAP